MNLLEGLKQKGAPAVIPECSRAELPETFVKMGYKVGAEIGVFKGVFTKLFCDVGLKMYGVDSWSHSPGNRRSQRRLDSYYDCANKTLAPYQNCTLIRKKSMDALSDFKDESLDFVYIDASHDFKYVAEDLCEWSRKVRKGGVISGHDYSNWTTPHESCHVKEVVNAYTRAFKINNWYLLGRKLAAPGTEGDRKWQRDNTWLSYLWIKE